jgi:hypothetical protein
MSGNIEEKKGKKEKVWECRKCGYNNPRKVKDCAKCGLDKATATTMKIKRKKYCDDCGHLHMLDTYCHVYVLAEDAFPEEDEGDGLQSILNGGSAVDTLEEDDDGSLNDGSGDDDDDNDEGGDDDDDDMDNDALFGAAGRRGNRLEAADAKGGAGDVTNAGNKEVKDEESFGEEEEDEDGDQASLRSDSNAMRRLETPDEIREAGFLRCNCCSGVPERSRRFIAFPARYEVGEILILTYQKVSVCTFRCLWSMYA